MKDNLIQKQYQEYSLVEVRVLSGYPTEFVNKINELMKQGFELYGELQVQVTPVALVYRQSMVRNIYSIN